MGPSLPIPATEQGNCSLASQGYSAQPIGFMLGGPLHDQTCSLHGLSIAVLQITSKLSALN